MNRALVIAALLAIPTAGHAHCYREAADRYQLNPDLLEAIAWVESRGRPEATNNGHIARTGTYDIGVMQINSSWLRKLSAFGITEKMLRDPCQNVMVGAWILSHHMNEDGSNWHGVGAYNASCRTLSKERCQAARGDYTWKVYRALLRKRGEPATTATAAVPQPRKISTGQVLAVASTPQPAPEQAVVADARRRISSVYVEDDVSTARIPVTEEAGAPREQTGSVWREKGSPELVAARSDSHAESH